MNIILLLLGSLAWIGLVLFLRQRRIWIFYYLAGTIGFSTLFVLVNRSMVHSEILLAKSIAESLHYLTGLIHIPTRIFEETPGLLLVLVVVQRVGWTALQIGVESSALLEISVLLGLIMFYPGWKIQDRLWRSLAGIALTWLANLLRMLMIVLMLHFLGKEVLVLAHTFLGKLVFFMCTVAIYWFLITVPSLKQIHTTIQQRTAQGSPA